jgi:hypothetical protein
VRPLTRRHRVLLARQIRDLLKSRSLTPGHKRHAADLIRYSISPNVASGQSVYNAANLQTLSRAARALDTGATNADPDVAAALALYRVMSNG